LELCAATLLAKLYKKAIHALNTINESYLWTDSSIVLTWIQGPSNKWKTFVGNRVAIIQEETSSATWRHVPTLSNPADLISRGVEPTILSTSTLWWKGTTYSKTITKGYIAIFVCFAIRAVHIEVVTSLTTGIPCCLKTFHSTSRKTKDNLIRQWYQLPRCSKSTS
jgi:hypothetical protein